MKFKLYVRLVFFCYLLLIQILYHQMKLSPTLGFMFLNVILAYIPLEIAFLIARTQTKLHLYILSMLWLLFYPNSVYLLSDFFHLEALNVYVVFAPFDASLMSWVAFSILTLGILFGYLVGLVSLYYVIVKWKQHLNIQGGLRLFLVLFTITYLAGFAIYLGRFSRLHTHHLLSNPLIVLDIIATAIHVNSLLFALVMAVWQLVIIYLLILFKPLYSQTTL